MLNHRLIRLATIAALGAFAAACETSTEPDLGMEIDTQAALVDQPDATPSARVLQDMRDNGTGFYHFAMNQAVGHKDYFAALEPLAGDRLAIYVDEAAASLDRQAEIETSDTMSFDEYLKQSYSEQGCSDCP